MNSEFFLAASVQILYILVSSYEALLGIVRGASLSLVSVETNPGKQKDEHENKGVCRIYHICPPYLMLVFLLW